MYKLTKKELVKIIVTAVLAVVGGVGAVHGFLYLLNLLIQANGIL